MGLFVLFCFVRVGLSGLVWFVLWVWLECILWNSQIVNKKYCVEKAIFNLSGFKGDCLITEGPESEWVTPKHHELRDNGKIGAVVEVGLANGVLYWSVRRKRSSWRHVRQPSLNLLLKHQVGSRIQMRQQVEDRWVTPHCQCQEMLRTVHRSLALLITN